MGFNALIAVVIPLWTFFTLIGQVDSDIISAARSPEWIQELYASNQLCHVSGSRMALIAPHCASEAGCCHEGDDAQIQALVHRGDSASLNGRVTLNSNSGEGYICASGLIIPFVVISMSDQCPSGAPVTVLDGSRYSNSKEGTTTISSDYTLEMSCSIINRTSPLPAQQVEPSPTRPFVFLHIDKVAGTTLRKIFHSSAMSGNYGYYIPCFGGVFCVTSELAPSFGDERDRQISVVAGHFAWGVWDQLPGYASRTAHGAGGGDTAPPCFVMFRNPVSRVVSYYYQRVYSPGHEFYGQKLNDLTEEKLRFIIRSMRHAARLADNVTKVLSDEGMADAACRILLGDRRTTGKALDTKLPSDELSEEDGAIAYANAQKCVIGMQDNMRSTFRALRHWFPWIQIKDAEHLRRNVGAEREDGEVLELLRPEIVRVIKEANVCDMYLYRRARERFWQQLESLR